MDINEAADTYIPSTRINRNQYYQDRSTLILPDQLMIVNNNG